MATFGYTRVSTTRQADEGESLLEQERKLAGYVLGPVDIGDSHG